jgi:hypothetical protein
MQIQVVKIVSFQPGLIDYFRIFQMYREKMIDQGLNIPAFQKCAALACQWENCAAQRSQTFTDSCE